MQKQASDASSHSLKNDIKKKEMNAERHGRKMNMYVGFQDNNTGCMGQKNEIKAEIKKRGVLLTLLRKGKRRA